MSYGGQSHAGAMDKKEAEMSYIMQAIANLDDSQRQGLVSILKDKKGPGFAGAESTAGSI